MVQEHVKNGKEYTNTVVSEDGELLSEEVKNETFVAGDAGEFFQIYASLISIIHKKLKAIDTHILSQIFVYANNQNLVALNKTLKNEIATKIGVGESTVSNSITALVKANILIRLDVYKDASYRINPRYFWKRSEGERKRVLKYVLTVECPTC